MNWKLFFLILTSIIFTANAVTLTGFKLLTTHKFNYGGSIEWPSISPDGKFFYISNSKTYIFNVNPSTGFLSYSSSYDLQGAGAYSTVVSPDNNFVYVTIPNTIDRTLAVLRRNKVDGTLSLVSNSLYKRATFKGLVISPDNKFAYVASSGSVNIFSIDSSGNLNFKNSFGTGAPWPVANQFYDTYGVVISPDGKFVYVNDIAGRIVILNRDVSTGSLSWNTAPTWRELDTKYYLFDLEGLSISKDGSYIFGGDPGAGRIIVFNRDAKTGSLTEFFNLGNMDFPDGSIMSPDGNYLYVSSFSAGKIYVFGSLYSNSTGNSTNSSTSNSTNNTNGTGTVYSCTDLVFSASLSSKGSGTCSVSVFDPRTGITSSPQQGNVGGSGQFYSSYDVRNPSLTDSSKYTPTFKISCSPSSACVNGVPMSFSELFFGVSFPQFSSDNLNPITKDLGSGKQVTYSISVFSPKRVLCYISLSEAVDFKCKNNVFSPSSYSAKGAACSFRNAASCVSHNCYWYGGRKGFCSNSRYACTLNK